MGNTLNSWWDKIHEDFDTTGKYKYLTNGSLSEYLSFFELRDWGYEIVLEMGIGTGRAIKELKALGKEVHAYDISNLALSRVRRDALIYNDPKKIPADYFDLILSRLVVQHLADLDLKIYLRTGLNVLKQEGIFAIQFADVKDMHFADANTGGMVRTTSEMKEFIQQAGGKIIKFVKPKTFKIGRIGTGHSEVVWHGIHVSKL